MNRITWALLFVAPPFVFFGWMIFGPETIGNDYFGFQILQALNLRYFLKSGVEPMWFPYLTGGVPANGLAMSQFFHFPGWLMSFFPGYWGGQNEAVRLFTARHILLFITGHLVFFWFYLLHAKLSKPVSYVLAFISVYNLRNLDLFRYGPGIDAMVYSSIGLLISLAYLGGENRRAVRWLPIFLVVTVQFLLTCGYPPLWPYSALAAAMILPALLFYNSRVRQHFFSRIGILLLATVIGAALAAPHLLPFYEWIEVNYTRVQFATIDWANFAPLRSASLFLNLFGPFSTEVHSSFAASTLITLVLSAIGFLGLFNFRRYWYLLLCFSLPFFYAFGKGSIVYEFFFYHVPAFGAIRVPGRVFAILPLLLAGFVYIFRDRLASADRKSLERAFSFAAVFVGLGLAYSLFLQLKYAGLGWKGEQIFLYAADVFYPEVWSTSMKVGWIFLGLIACAMIAWRKTFRGLFLYVLIFIAVMQTAALMRFGTWHAVPKKIWSWSAFTGANMLPLQAKVPIYSVNGLRENMNGSATIPYTRFMKAAGKKSVQCYLPIYEEQYDRGVLLPYYLSDRIKCEDSVPAVFSAMKAEDACVAGMAIHTFLIGSECRALGYSERPITGVRPNRSLAHLNALNELVYLTPNLFTLRVKTNSSSVLISPYPFVNKNWHASVDGREVEPILVNGAFVGVSVPSGKHEITVSYFSGKAIWGYRIFWGAMALLFLWVIHFYMKISKLGVAGLVLVLMGMAAYFTEQYISERASVRMSFPHNYQELLRRQLDRWKQ